MVSILPAAAMCPARPLQVRHWVAQAHVPLVVTEGEHLGAADSVRLPVVCSSKGSLSLDCVIGALTCQPVWLWYTGVKQDTNP